MALHAYSNLPPGEEYYSDRSKDDDSLLAADAVVPDHEEERAVRRALLTDVVLTDAQRADYLVLVNADRLLVDAIIRDLALEGAWPTSQR